MTPLVQLPELSKYVGYPNLWIKDESVNPTGTFKDRKSLWIINKAKRAGIRQLCLITSGNAGLSLSSLADQGMSVYCLVDGRVKASIKQKLKQVAKEVIEIDLRKKIYSSKDLFDFAGLKQAEGWDVTNGYHQAYRDIIKEIKQLAPDVVICPVGSGESFTGLYEGLIKYQVKAKLVGVTPAANPSYADKLHKTWTPYARHINQIVNKGHSLIKVSESDVRKSYLRVKPYLKCEPSSAIVWAAFAQCEFKPKTKIVVINSGQGLI
jgi:threonine synthase